MTTRTFGMDLSDISESVKPLEYREQIEFIGNKILEKAKTAALKGERNAEYILQEDSDKLNESFLSNESKQVLIIFQNEDVIVKFEHRLYCHNDGKCNFRDGERCWSHPGYVICWI